MHVIETLGVSKEFRSAGILAVDNASIAVDEGDFVSLLGPSGCGKSTLLHLLAGLAMPSSGSVTYRGERVTRPLTTIGVAFQDSYLLDWRSVRDNVLLQFDMRGAGRRDRRSHIASADRLLSEVGLAGFGDKHVWELSGGMKQRVALCRTLIHEPEVLLLDEPFGALDMLTRDQLNLDLSRLAHERQVTTVLVTHSIAEAVFLSRRVLVMSPRPGRIVAEVQVELPTPRELPMRRAQAYADGVDAVYRIFQNLGVLHGA